MDLSTVYMSLKLRNPIIAGSSGLTGTPEKVAKCAAAGAGAVVLKSVFEEQIESELGELSRDGWYPEAMDYIRTYGMNNAVQAYLDLLTESRNACDIPVIPSIHCFGTGKWTDFAAQLESAGASAIELNAYILASDPRRNGRENEETILDIVTDVKSKVSIPVAVKIGSHFSALSSFVKELDGVGVDAVVVFNRFFSIDFDIENITVIDGEPFSTPGEANEVLRWVSLLNPVTSCDICATTGIHDGAGVVKQLLAGANAVQVSSVLYREGLEAIGRMQGFMVDWMRRHGYGSVEEFRETLSASASTKGNPAEFRRVQFMRKSVSE